MPEVADTADAPPPFRRSVPPPVPGLLLLWTDKAPRYQAFPLASAPRLIGRDPSCPIVIAQDATVSRRHAEVSLDGATGELVVRDDASRHGTFVDGAPVHGERRVPLARTVLRVGASIFLGVADLGPHLALLSSAAVSPITSLFDAQSASVLGPSMRALRVQVVDAAKTSAPLLVLGESGVGKAAIAQLFHDAGPRARGPFVSFNSATISPALADGELFGAVRGAYTGAERDRAGLFVAADCGVLFLDEVGELAPEVQAKLLQVVEDGWVRPVGADPNRRARVDVALVSATHVDLRAAVKAGRFRGDLLQRLRRREVRVPPLRDRLEEVPFLLEHYRTQLEGAVCLSATMVEACLLYAWPFNVRQLINLVDESVTFSKAMRFDRLALPPDALDPRDFRGTPTLFSGKAEDEAVGGARVPAPDAAIPGTPTGPPPARVPSEQELRDAEFFAFVEREHGGNVAAAARVRGISVSTAHDRANRHKKRLTGRE